MKRLALLLSLFAASAFAQLRETTTVEVIEVPVYVTLNGAPVTTLTRDNFELFVNGKKRAIDYFDTIDHAALSPEQSRDVHQRRLYMLVFDLLSVPNALHRAQKAAVEFIDAAGDNDNFGAATYGYDGMKVLVPFTKDRLVIRRAIRNLQSSRAGDPLHLTMSGSERGEELGRPGRMLDPRYDTNIGDLEVDPVNLVIDEIYFLGDLAHRLAGIEGQKHIVLLSTGFDDSILFGFEGAPRPGDIRTGPMRSFRDLNQSTAFRQVAAPNANLMLRIRSMSETFASAGVFLDAIDIGGVRPYARFTDGDSLFALAHPTGGQLVNNRNDLHDAIGHLTEIQRVVYVLGFRATDTGKETNRIDVKLVGAPRGARASNRPSYSSLAAITDSSDTLLLADIINNDIPQNGITTAIAAESSPTAATVEVTIPGRELLAQAGSDVAGAQAMLYVLSGKTVVSFKVKRISIDVPKAGAALDSAPIRVRETFDLPPGKYAAKVLVRLDNTGSLGFARTDFSITP
jgi:VWFA-related protein